MSDDLYRVLNEYLNEGKIDEFLKLAFGFGLKSADIDKLIKANPNVTLERVNGYEQKIVQVGNKPK